MPGGQAGLSRSSTASPPTRDVRCADVASDLAFLLMDLLTRFDAHLIAVTLLARYRATGLELPDQLLRLGTAHLVLVRAKIACLRLADASPGGGSEPPAQGA